MVEIGEENESAELVVVKMSEIQKFRIDYLTFYSRGLEELEGFRSLMFWTERTKLDHPPGLVYESWHPQHRFIRNSIIARKILSCCMLLSLFVLGTCQMSLNQWSSLF